MTKHTQQRITALIVLHKAREAEERQNGNLAGANYHFGAWATLLDLLTSINR